MAKPDPSYSWKLADTVEREGARQFVISLTSQTWRTREEVDRTVWEHWLVIVKPPRVSAKTAFLYIGGGRNRPEPPRGADELALRPRAADDPVAGSDALPTTRP